MYYMFSFDVLYYEHSKSFICHSATELAKRDRNLTYIFSFCIENKKSCLTKFISFCFLYSFQNKSLQIKVNQNINQRLCFVCFRAQSIIFAF